jgi:hypothetical protein
MSKIVSTKEQRIRAKLDNIFGNSVAAQELKSIALKSALEGWSDDEKADFWKNKQADLDELKEATENDLALPTESIVMYADQKNQEHAVSYSITDSHDLSASIIEVNGTFELQREREDGRNENASIKYEVFEWNPSERESQITDELQSEVIY